MTDKVIKEGDWVMICENGEKGFVVQIYDEGERFLVYLPVTSERPYPRRVHIMVEKIRKIRPIKPKATWCQSNLFEGESK